MVRGGVATATIERPIAVQGACCDQLAAVLAEREQLIAMLEAERGELMAQLSAFQDEVARWVETLSVHDAAG